MNIGFAFCGSFCSHAEVLKVYEALAEEHRMIPIVSERAAAYDTRFGTAEAFLQRVESVAGRRAIRTVTEAEPFGPQGMADVLVIAPCTGNTLARLAHGITDGTVTMAAKSHLRNERPVVIAFAGNDGLSGSAPNLAAMLLRKHCFFVPFGQDDPQRKPNSLVADFARIPEAVECALAGRQVQPLLL